MDDKDELMRQMWENWKPYNQGGGGKWRSYVISGHEATLLETEADCVTIVDSPNGLYVA